VVLTTRFHDVWVNLNIEHDFRRIFQGRQNRAVLAPGKFERAQKIIALKIAYAFEVVGYFSEPLRVFFRLHAVELHFEPGELPALFLDDRDDIHGHATGECDQQ
jgi:hypothetical protein